MLSSASNNRETKERKLSMSTRSVIARRKGNGFVGVYHHWDGYPRGLGASLFETLKKDFGGDVEAMLKTIIDEHPAGWSTLVGCSFIGQIPGYINYIPNATPKDEERYNNQPKCFCHGERNEEGQEVTQLNASGMGCEYAYVFDGNKMHILSSFHEDGTKAIGMFGCGDPDATWREMYTVNLDWKEEPDWEKIEEGNLVSTDWKEADEVEAVETKPKGKKQKPTKQTVVIDIPNLPQRIKKVRSIISSAGSKIASVHFNKRSNGKLRKMAYRLHVQNPTCAKAPIGNSNTKDKDKDNLQMTVFDVNKVNKDKDGNVIGRGAWRTIPLENVVRVCVDGTVYECMPLTVAE